MSSLKDKLYNYEQMPPPTAWDKIASALDDSHLTDQFPSTIYNAEAEPPKNAWDKILSGLDAEHAPAIPMPRRSSSFFRYAAAAVLLALVSFGVIKWMNRNSGTGGDSVASVDSTKNHPVSIAKDDVGKQEVIVPQENLNDVTQVKTAAAKKTKSVDSRSFSNVEPEPIYASAQAPNLADRYIMYMTPDGGIVRMSKKWGNLVCCVSGQEQDEDCKDQLKKWQERLACSQVATSNFMDIFSLVNTLNNTEL